MAIVLMANIYGRVTNIFSINGFHTNIVIHVYEILDSLNVGLFILSSDRFTFLNYIKNCLFIFFNDTPFG